jgi:2-polyprenyl-3-methyl-5-hydroxy-6-metoxy-1,4-benzoquinol methylase
MKKTKYIPENFYSVYNEHREYVVPNIRKKHKREFRKSYWDPCRFTSDMSVLEIGCGTGLFLEFIKREGVASIVGVDADSLVLDYMPEDLKKKIIISDVNDFLSSLKSETRFDRVVMIDVLEHFNPQEGVNLLESIRPFLTKNSGIVVRVPNLSSPWGAKWQYHDLTHKAAYTPGSLRQLGLMAGFNCKIFPHRRGNPRKQIFENLFHSFLDLIVTDPPDLWSSMMVGFFEPQS